jgi:hypothetical protein
MLRVVSVQYSRSSALQAIHCSITQNIDLVTGIIGIDILDVWLFAAQ